MATAATAATASSAYTPLKQIGVWTLSTTSAAVPAILVRSAQLFVDDWRRRNPLQVGDGCAEATAFADFIEAHVPSLIEAAQTVATAMASGQSVDPAIIVRCHQIRTLSNVALCPKVKRGKALVSCGNWSLYGTLNPQGGQEYNVNLPCLEEMDKAFQSASASQCPILDVGCGLGVHTKRALQYGACVIACDFHPKNLSLMLREITDLQHLKRLQIMLAQFGEPVDSQNDLGIFLSPACVSYVVLTQVIHFMRSRQLLRGISQLHKWMRPDAKVFCVAISVQHTNFLNDAQILRAKTVSAAAAWTKLLTTTHKAPLDERHMHDMCKSSLYFPHDVPGVTMISSAPRENLPLLYSQIELSSGLVPHAQALGITDALFAYCGFHVTKAEHFNIYGDTLRVETKSTGEFLLVVASKPNALSNNESCATAASSTSSVTKLVSHPCAATECLSAAVTRCSRCKNVYYCSSSCQIQSWRAHKSFCHGKS